MSSARRPAIPQLEVPMDQAVQARSPFDLVGGMPVAEPIVVASIT